MRSKTRLGMPLLLTPSSSLLTAKTVRNKNSEISGISCRGLYLYWRTAKPDEGIRGFIHPGLTLVRGIAVKKLFALMVVAALATAGCDDKKTTAPPKITPVPSSPAKPVDPPVKPVDPPVKPVDPPVKPVDPPVKPVDPPVKPVDPPVKPKTPEEGPKIPK